MQIILPDIRSLVLIEGICMMLGELSLLSRFHVLKQSENDLTVCSGDLLNHFFISDILKKLDSMHPYLEISPYELQGIYVCVIMHRVRLSLLVPKEM